MNYLKKSICLIILFSVLAVFSCGKEAPTVNPGDYTSGTGGVTPGYSYPYVTGIYPAHLSTDVPINSNVTILFNIPVNIDNTDITIAATSSGPWSIGSNVTLNTGLNYAQLVFTGGFDTGETISITTTAGILDAANGIALNNPQTYQFTVSTYVADVTGPWDTGYTPNGGSEPVNTNITITFNETVDPATVNSNTFYLTNVAGDTVEGAITNVGTTYTLNPTNDLLMSTPTATQTYTVQATSGIKDMSGNSYAGTPSWAFTTVLETDVTGPSLSGSGPSINYITDASAEINWTTNEPTRYSLDYGTGTDLAEIAVTDPLYTVTHAETLTGLDPGSRYYYQITATDEFGNSTTSSVYEFNTQTPETVAGTTIAGGAGQQLLAKYIPQKTGVTNTGAFVFWYAGTYHINAALYNSGFTQSWTTGVYPDNYRYLSAVEDDTGGVIILASNAGTAVYAKRLTGGSFDWGYSEGVTGLKVDTNSASVTNASAAPVYRGFLTTIVSNQTTTMNIPANAFYDFNQDLRTGITNGDIVYRTSSPSATSGATVTISTNFRHVIGQSSAAVDTNSSDTYVIFDSGTSAGPYNSDDHTIATTSAPVLGPGIDWTGTYISGIGGSGATITYTEHGISGIANTGDLIYDETNYALVSLAPTTIGPITPIASGADNNIGAISYLRDNETDFTLIPVELNDYVLNITNPGLAQVNDNDPLNNYPDPNGDPIRLGLTLNIFNITSFEDYEIYDQFDSNYPADLTQFDSFDEIIFDWSIDIAPPDTFRVYSTINIPLSTADTPPTSPLYDDGADFSVTGYNVQNDDIVFNSSTGAWTYVTDVTYAANGALGLNANIMSDGQTYSIFRLAAGYTRSDIVDNGRAGASTTSNVLYDATTVAVVGDIVYNVNDQTYSVIASISAGNYYRLAGSPGFAPNEGYIILHPNTTTDLKNVLYAWQEGTSVHWRIYTMDDAPPTAVNAEQTIANAQNPYAISDGKGNAYLVYMTTGGQLVARIYPATGTAYTWTQNVGAVTAIHNVISDNNGGIIVLYQNGGTMYVRRILDNSGYSSPWSGTITTTAPTSTDMVCNSTATSVIIAGQVNNDIYAWRRGGTSWDATISTASDIQQNPKIYAENNWTTGNTRIVWEDNRFVTGGGYGIFGQQIATIDGTRAWDADDNGGATDMNGVSVILNSANGYWPNMIVVPYNNNASANIIWDDWRNVTCDIVYRSLSGFTP